jgi:hypothetical protein
VLGIIRQAAVDDPGLAALWTGIAERRSADIRLFVTDLAGVACVRPALAGPPVSSGHQRSEMCRLAGRDGSSLQLCERFLDGTWQRLLLAGEGPGLHAPIGAATFLMQPRSRGITKLLSCYFGISSELRPGYWHTRN